MKSLRHYPESNGALMAQSGFAPLPRAPKAKPMAHWCAPLVFSNGALMAHWDRSDAKKPERKEQWREALYAHLDRTLGATS
jgi:hypothetical protein